MTNTPEDRVLAVAAETKGAFYEAVDQLVSHETASGDPQRDLPSTGETQIDTSAEAVERLAIMLDNRADYHRDVDRRHLAEIENKRAATIRALAAERDALAEKADKYKWQVRVTCVRAERAEGALVDAESRVGRRRAERDAALARAEAAERDRDALMKVSRAALLVARNRPVSADKYGWLGALNDLAEALDELPPS